MFFFFQAEDGIRDLVRSRGLGDVYKRQEYAYSEGGMVFPEPLDKPSRTIITGEGGRSPSRFKHVILTKSGRYRRLNACVFFTSGADAARSRGALGGGGRS